MRRTLFILMIACVAASVAGRLEITNDTGNYEFYYVKISLSSADSWGEDRLGSSETISPGETRAFRLNNGTYDIRIIDEDEDEYIFWNVNISGTVSMYVDLDDLGEQNWGSSTSVGGTAPITIENDLGSWTIWYIYGDSSDSPWGDDRLGSELLASGETFTFYVPADDYYDLRVVDEDDDVYTLWEVWVDSDGFYWSVDLSDMD